MDTRRVIIEHISPQVDGGRFAIKRCDGDILVVAADIYLGQLTGRDSLASLIGRVNRIWRDNPALQQDWRLQLHDTDNPQFIGYSNTTEDFGNVLITVVNLDPHRSHSGWVQLRLETLGLSPQAFVVQDLLTAARSTWQGPYNHVALDPPVLPAHILLVDRRVDRRVDA